MRNLLFSITIGVLLIGGFIFQNFSKDNVAAGEKEPRVLSKSFNVAAGEKEPRVLSLTNYSLKL